MTPPSSLSRSDAATPIDASADAAVRTDAASSPDAGTSPDAGATTSSTPDARAADAGTPADAGRGPDAARPSRSPLTLELDGFVGGARLGGPNGTLFSPDFSPANEGWNHSRAGVGVGFNYSIWNPIPQFNLGAGAHLRYFNLQGDRHTPGRLDGGELSAHLDASFPITEWLAPFLRPSVSAILATGETTAGNNFSVDHTGGFGVALRGDVGVRITYQDFSISPSFFAETGFIPNARGMAAAPWVAFGGALMMGYTPGSARVVRSGADVCTDGVTEETATSIGRRVGTLRGAIETLRRENDQLREAVRTAHPELNVDEIDGLQSVEAIRIPNPLPTDCGELLALKNALENERDALDRQNGLLEGVRRAPASAAPRLVRAITRLSEIHFITARPFGTPDTPRGAEPRATIEVLDQARETYLGSHPADGSGNREAAPIADIETAFAAVFPRTTRTDGSTYSPSIAALQEISTALRSPDMRGMRFYIVGNTDSRGTADMNGRLSLRRAGAIRDVLIMLGVNPEMLIPIGRGENNLVYHYDQRRAGRRGDEPGHVITRSEITMLRRDGITGTSLDDEVRGRQSTNRRVEMFVCGSDTTGDAVCEALGREVAPASSTSSTGSPVTTVPAGR